jgi:serine/threonine protein kinase
VVAAGFFLSAPEWCSASEAASDIGVFVGKVGARSRGKAHSVRLKMVRHNPAEWHPSDLYNIPSCDDQRGMLVNDDSQPPGNSVERKGPRSSGTERSDTAAGLQKRVSREQGSSPGVLTENSRFGAYVVGECIGQGGMARVYRAEHEGLQRQVALKVLLDGLGKDSDGHERFLREARIAAAIKHPNVVNIFDVGVHQGTPYLVMELLEGVDLDAFVETKNRLDEATIMDIVVPIAGALAAVHDAGIVHRDLKPGNIFLARGRNDEIEPRLLDFGISKSMRPDQMKLTSARGLVMGTPFYMSPEAARGAEMTPLSDQYALGVVLYECATGVNPFTPANSFAEVVQRVTTGTFQPVATHNALLSKKMVAIIERAMQLDPERRFPDMRAMGRELLMLAGQRTRITWGLSFNQLAPLSNHPKAAASFAKAKKSRGSRRALLAVPAVVAALLLAGAWTVSRQQHNDRLADATAGAAPLTAPDTHEMDSAQALALRPNLPSAEPSPAPRDLAPVVADKSADRPELDPVGQALPRETALDAKPAPAAGGGGTEVAVAVRDALRKPPRSRTGSRKRSNPTAALAAPAISVADTPDWAPAASRTAAASDTAAHRGTNNAPILD